jgi:uncharacterized protein YgiB involved in biofilm formation
MIFKILTWINEFRYQDIDTNKLINKLIYLLVFLTKKESRSYVLGSVTCILMLIIINSMSSVSDVYVFNSVKSCENFNEKNNISGANCQDKYDNAMLVAEKIKFDIKDGSFCALYYGPKSCKQDIFDNTEFQPIAIGFVYSDNDDFVSLPIYYSRPIGSYITPSAFPVRIGKQSIIDMKINKFSELNTLNEESCKWINKRNARKLKCSKF